MTELRENVMSVLPTSIVGKSLSNSISNELDVRPPPSRLFAYSPDTIAFHVVLLVKLIVEISRLSLGPKLKPVVIVSDCQESIAPVAAAPL